MMKRIEHEDEAITGVEMAREYAKMHEKHKNIAYSPFLKDMKRLNPWPLKGKANGRCLEIGAGTGIMTTLFAEANPDIEITATDISPDMATVARQYIRDKGLQDRIDYQMCDANSSEDLKRLGKFDIVYSIFSFHHWTDPGSSFVNLLNAVKDGGILYLGDLKRVWWLYYLPVNDGFFESVRGSYRAGEIKDILNDNGIERYTIKTLSHFFLQSVTIRC